MDNINPDSEEDRGGCCIQKPICTPCVNDATALQYGYFYKLGTLDVDGEKNIEFDRKFTTRHIALHDGIICITKPGIYYINYIVNISDSEDLSGKLYLAKNGQAIEGSSTAIGFSSTSDTDTDSCSSSCCYSPTVNVSGQAIIQVTSHTTIKLISEEDISASAPLSTDTMASLTIIQLTGSGHC